jgi:hypothetical protein
VLATPAFSLNIPHSRNPLDTYRAAYVPAPDLANSARINTLVHNGVLELTLHDAIALALENNLDLMIQRYNIPIAKADVLRTRAGGVFRGVGLVTYWGFLARGRADRQLRMYLVTRPLMIGLILAGLPWGPVGVAVGHSAAFGLYWLVSLLHMGRVTGLDARRLLRQALAALVTLALPLGLLAHLGTRLVDGTVPQLLLGGLLALAWVGLLLLVLPAQRADLVAARGLLRRERVSP